ncbi:MAG: 2-oxo acid dehydrogenase subunit E2 [bacterium]
MAQTQITVPDIGDFDEVEVIEVLVAAGQTVAAEDPLITLESDKATMDIPAPRDGTIAQVLVEVGQMVSQGTPIAVLAEGDGGDATAESAVDSSSEASESASAESPAAMTSSAEKSSSKQTPTEQSSTPPQQPQTAPADAPAPGTDSHTPPALPPTPAPSAGAPHASPAVRSFARELGASLARIGGSGPKGRILKSDVQAWIKQQLRGAAGADSTGGIPPVRAIDFAKFGATEQVPLSRIKKLSGPHLQRAWLNLPHVTHHDEADITELEKFRQELKAEAERDGIRITLLGFVIKILAGALRKFPSFNASLHPDGDRLIVKKYYNIGIAVDTPQGLVVPVIRAVERKTIFDLAREMGELSERARAGRLKPDDLQGGCISISSLGGIGGRAFTPIVNAPEVAILGLTRARMTPVWDGAAFQPRLMLPLDLSYDHRVIDGAEAARFVAHLIESFGDVRRLAL